MTRVSGAFAVFMGCSMLRLGILALRLTGLSFRTLGLKLSRLEVCKVLGRKVVAFGL